MATSGSRSPPGCATSSADRRSPTLVARGGRGRARARTASSSLPYFAGERTPDPRPERPRHRDRAHARPRQRHLYRAALEGIAFGVRHNLEVIAPRTTPRTVVRFRLDLDHLPTIHNRFSVNGFWSATRDLSQSTIAAALAVSEVDALFGPQRPRSRSSSMRTSPAELGAAGILVTMFHLGDVDLGRTGEVMEATARARHELDREQAEAAMRVARARSTPTWPPSPAPAAPTSRCATARSTRGASSPARAQRGRAGDAAAAAPDADQPSRGRATPTDARTGAGSADGRSTSARQRTASSRCWPSSCSASPRSGRRGAGTRPRAGTARRTSSPARQSDLQVEAARQFGLATQTVSYDSNMVAQYAQAVRPTTPRLQEFIRDSPGPAGVPAPAGRVAAARSRPARRRRTCSTTTEYLDAQLGPYRATEARGAGDCRWRPTRPASNADDYVLTTLLLASALFFAGLTTSFRVRFAQLLLLAGSTVLIGYAAARLSGLPVTLSDVG